MRPEITSINCTHHGLIVRCPETLESGLGNKGGGDDFPLYQSSLWGFERDDRVLSPGLRRESTRRCSPLPQTELNRRFQEVI